MEQQFKIEKNIPIARRIYAKVRYPFDKMKINDSFFVPFEGNIKGNALYMRIRNSYTTYKRKEGEKDFKIITATNEKGIRVWRIA